MGQKAGRSIGRTWQGGKAELETRWVESLLVLYLCVLSVFGLSLIAVRANPLTIRGNYCVGSHYSNSPQPDINQGI